MSTFKRLFNIFYPKLKENCHAYPLLPFFLSLSCFFLFSSVSFASLLLGDRIDLPIPTAAARDIGVADFNLDGIQDVVITDVHHNNVILYLGTGDGTFLPPVTFSVGFYPSFLAIGDINLDNNPDIITSNAVSGPPSFIPYSSISVLLGKGDGTFEELKDYPTTSYYYGDFTLGDFNNDTYPDILLHLGQLLLGNGDGSFQPAVNTGCSGIAMTVGDFDYDNNLDIVVAYSYAGSSHLDTYLGNGDGTFAVSVALPVTSGISVDKLTTGDIDHDGILDLIALGHTPYWRCIMTFEGTGTPALFVSPHVTTTSLAYGDLKVDDYDNDGNLDIMALAFQGTLSFFKGWGLLYPELIPPIMQMPFSAPQNFETLYSATDLTSGDLNGDNFQDFVLIYGQTNFMSLFLNGSTGTTSFVRIDDRQIKIKKRLPDSSLDIERPYFIEGVAWQPATRAPATGPDPDDPLGAEIDYGFFFTAQGVVPEHMFYWWQQEFENHYVEDIALMKDMNVNTVRMYIALGEDGVILTKAQEILDELYANNIMVDMTVASGKRDLCTDTMDPICSDPPRYEPVVEMFKDHPAILMWTIGNEWNFPWALTSLGFSDLNEAKTLINNAAQNIKSMDPHHPVTSSLGDDFGSIPGIIATVDAVDIWGMNVYRGSSFGVLFDQWSGMTTKPFYLSEYGTDSFFSNTYNDDGLRVYDVVGFIDETLQADFIYGLHEEIVHNQAKDQNTELCTGGFIFEFNDALWKVGNYHVGLGFNDFPPGRVAGNDYEIYSENGFLELGGHPDGVSNQEYFGVVDADRMQKVAFDVLTDSFVPNSPVGNDVEYTDTEGETTLTFDEIIAEGHTEVTESTVGPNPPTGFQLLENYYDITSTAAFTGQIEVCIGYDDTGLTQQQEIDLRLYHYESPAWVDVTLLPNDINNNIVCGEVSFLSPFAIMKLNHPPIADAGDDQIVECTSFTGCQVALDGSGTTDPDNDVLTYTWTGSFPEGNGVVTGLSPTVTLTLGTHTIILDVNDGNGGTDSDEVQVTVQDTTPPTITVTVDPDVLWPPNHKMVLITPTITVSDICDTTPTVTLMSITMNEGDQTDTYDPNYDDDTGDGNTTNDIEVDENGDIYLRAERKGNSDGRVYTLTYVATDASGNSATVEATVTVPHNM